MFCIPDEQYGLIQIIHQPYFLYKIFLRLIKINHFYNIMNIYQFKNIDYSLFLYNYQANQY